MLRKLLNNRKKTMWKCIILQEVISKPRFFRLIFQHKFRFIEGKLYIQIPNVQEISINIEMFAATEVISLSAFLKRPVVMKLI